ncbi:MAG: peptidoglycan-binding domain-containing protein [Acidobacteriota bacterium]
MRVFLLTLTALCLPLCAASPKAAAKKPVAKVSTKVAAKAPAARAKSTKGTVKTVATGKAKSKTRSKAPAKSKKPVTPSYASQQHPSTERYAQIQQALVERGYLGEANGNWDASSIAAMKRFQEDQALPTDGKLTALSLTALGLGPRRGAFVVGPLVPANSTVAAVE